MSFASEFDLSMEWFTHRIGRMRQADGNTSVAHYAARDCDWIVIANMSIVWRAHKQGDVIALTTFLDDICDCQPRIQYLWKAWWVLQWPQVLMSVPRATGRCRF